MDELIRINRQKVFETWTICDPGSRNSLGPRLLEALQRNLGRLEQELSRGSADQPQALFIRATPLSLEKPALLDGAARRIWMAGGNLKELYSLSNWALAAPFFKAVQACLGGIERLPIPVVTCVEGLVIGGGVEFSLIGDIRLATGDSLWYFKQLEIGVPCGFGGFERLCRICGPDQANYLVMSRAKLGPEQALQHGIVHEVMGSSEALEKRLDDLAEGLTGIDPQLFKAQKQLAVTSPQLVEKELATFAPFWMTGSHLRFMETFIGKHH